MTADRSFQGRMRLMDAIARRGVTPRFWEAFLVEVERLTPADLEAVLRAVVREKVPVQERVRQEL
jgi:hypothetical protein